MSTIKPDGFIYHLEYQADVSIEKDYIGFSIGEVDLVHIKEQSENDRERSFSDILKAYNQNISYNIKR